MDILGTKAAVREATTAADQLMTRMEALVARLEALVERINGTSVVLVLGNQSIGAVDKPREGSENLEVHAH